MGGMREAGRRAVGMPRRKRALWAAAALVCGLVAVAAASPTDLVQAAPRETTITWPALAVIVFNLLLFVVWFFGRRIRAQMERAAGSAGPADGDVHDTTLLPLAVTRAIGIIERRYQEKLDIHGVAAEVCVKPGYLAKLFKESTGKTLAEYVDDFRLEQAAELIRTTRMGLTEIQHTVGISDSSWFTEAFQRKVGTSPSELIRRREILD